ncbi:Nucleic acid-binding, OB-fold [Sesbania bispinosa]|nr:Nucleic acid-binding, OB-fold [Sesbania bispinosa]
MAMVSTGYHAIKNLCGRRESWRLKVKLVRIWNMCALATPEEPFALQMVLFDDGDMIEATVLKQNMRRFANVMVEGQVYKLTNFGVMLSKCNFRASGHDYKIIFNANTKNNVVVAAVIPHMGLKFVKTSDIKNTNDHSDYLLDFVGIVTAVFEEMNLNRQGRPTRLMLIDMVDEMGKIRCAVFGQLIDAICGFLSVSQTNLPVMIFQLARVNLYKGEIGIQNVMNATKIWWNLDIAEAVEFKVLFSPIDAFLAVYKIKTDMAISIISDRCHPISKRDEFLKLYPRKTIGQLHDLVEVGST